MTERDTGECSGGHATWTRIGTTAGGTVAIERCDRCRAERRRQLDG